MEPTTEATPDPAAQVALANMQLKDAQTEVQRLRQACMNLEITVRVLTQMVAASQR